MEAIDSQVVLLCGISGSGKTTVARQLETRGYITLSIDRMMWEAHGLCGKDYPEAQYPEYRDRAEIQLLKKLTSLISDGQKVTIDSPLCKRAKRDHYRQYVTSAGADYTLLYLDTPLDILKERLRKRNLSPGPEAAIVTDDMVEMYYRGFERPGDDEPHVTITPQ